MMPLALGQLNHYYLRHLYALMCVCVCDVCVSRVCEDKSAFRARAAEIRRPSIGLIC